MADKPKKKTGGGGRGLKRTRDSKAREKGEKKNIARHAKKDKHLKVRCNKIAKEIERMKKDAFRERGDETMGEYHKSMTQYLKILKFGKKKKTTERVLKETFKTTE